MSNVQNLMTLVKANIQLFQQVNQLYGKELAPHFNSLDFWHINENKVTQILAFFLNPKEKHSHGDLYLRHFLAKFNLHQFHFSETDTIKVHREYLTSQGRRIDLLIVKNNFEQVIAIENKIHEETNDQKNQLKDYWNFISQKAQYECCLVYLSPEGKILSDLSIGVNMKKDLLNQGSLLLLNYEQHLIGCIHEFGNITQNYRVKSFLKDFELKLKRKYMGVENVNNTALIAKLITENSTNLDAAFLISTALNDAKELLKEEFKHQLEDLAKEFGLAFQVLSNKTLFTPTGWLYHKIALSYESGGILVGIKKNSLTVSDAESQAYNQEFLRLKLDLKKFKSSKLFPAYTFIYTNIQTYQSFWKEVKSEERKAQDKVRTLMNQFLVHTSTGGK